MAVRSTFFRVPWRCFLVFAVFFVCFPHSSGGTTELEDTLRCALLGTFNKTCKVEGGPELKPYLFELLKRSPASFRGILRGRVGDLRPPVAGNVPTALVYLVPDDVWSRVPHKTVSELIKLHKTKKGVAKALMRGYSKASLTSKKEFLHAFNFNSVDYSMASMMASDISSNWTKDNDVLVDNMGPSFYVALPATRVLGMDREQQIAMLNEIVQWEVSGLNKEKWYTLPALTKRVWAIISKNYSYAGPDKRLSTPLLAGATPTELPNEGKLASDYELVKLPLKNRLQIRALFPIVRQEDILNKFDLNLLKGWFLFLSPDQIRRFRDGLDLMFIVKEKQHEYWSYPIHQKPFAVPSVPTLRQIIEITTMLYIERGELPLDPAAWQDKIAVFGPLTFLIGARRLGKLESNHEPLGLQTLKSIDSYLFSKRMARHLMFNSTNTMKVRGLLRGVSTRNLVNSGESGIDGMDKLREIVQNLPADVPARTALVFRKIRENLGVVDNLEAILRNPYPEQFASLLTLKETATLYKGLTHHWTRIQSENLDDKIHLLPDSILSNFLIAPKMLAMDAALSALLEPQSLGGTTCERLLAVNAGIIPETVAAARYARKKAGKTDMSKKLQRCARIAMDRFLIERASATYASKREVTKQPSSAINPVDIVNFGGFVMATLTPVEIGSNRYGAEIMKEIGSLSVYELVSAIPCYKCLQKMAETAVEIIDGERNLKLSHLLDLGSLVGFLPTRLIKVVDPADWRTIAEAASLDGSSQPLCADEESRDEWEKIIRSAFGEPEHWTADILATLGGFMPALRDNTLQAVSLDERAKAGDTIGITSGSPYLQGVEVFGYDHPRAFWKVCRDLLGQDDRKNYEESLYASARFQLNAAQLFARKVKNADTLKELKSQKPRLSSKSAESSTEPPLDLSGQVVTPSSTTSTSWLFPSWFDGKSSEKDKDHEVSPPHASEDKKSDEVHVPTPAPTSLWTTSSWSHPAKKDDNPEPATPAPAKDTELKPSDDLLDFINESWDKTEPDKTEPSSAGPMSTPVTMSSVNEEETEEPTSPPVTLQMIETSLDALKTLEDLPSNHTEVNATSQVVVDPENGRGDESDYVENPSSALRFNLNEAKIPSAVPSTTEPPNKKTNGTVFHQLPVLSIANETSKIVTTTQTPAIEGDETVIVTPAKDIANTANVTSPGVTARLPTTTTSPIPHSSSVAPNSNGGSSRRRRRDVTVESFEVPLTCDGLMTMGPAAALALSTSDVDMADEELEDCVEFIGNLELPKEVAKAFWRKLKMATHWDTVGDVGCLIAGMTSDEVENLQLDTKSEHFLDTISAVSSYADKDVLKSVILKLNSQMEEEIASTGTVALAEEIVLALGPNVCLLPEQVRSFLVNMPNVLLRSLSGINRKEFFERSTCEPECFRSLLTALVNQNKTREWLPEDIRNAGVLVAGFPEEELKKMSGVKTSGMFAELSAGAARCFSESQLKAMEAENFIWWSPIAAGALSEDQLKFLPENREVLEGAVLGRPGFNATQEEEVILTSGASYYTSNLALIVTLTIMVVNCYLL